MAKTTGTALHYMVVCQYGIVHNQCECPSDDKAIQNVKCDNSRHIPGDRKEKVKSRLMEYNLRLAGSNLREVEALRDKRLAEVRKVVKAANKAGYSKTQIAVTVGLSRNVIHNMLTEEK